MGVPVVARADEPRELTQLANRTGTITVGSAVDRISVPGSTRTRPAPPPIIHARLAAGIRLGTDELTPALLATIKHAASMPNPLFYERQRRRASTWDVPRFLRSYDETLDGGLILPRGLGDHITASLRRLLDTGDRVNRRRICPLRCVWPGGGATLPRFAWVSP